MSPDIARNSDSKPASDSLPGRGTAHPGFLSNWRAALSVAAGLAYPFLVYWVLTHPHPTARLLLTMTALLGLCATLPKVRTRLMAVLVVLGLSLVSVAFATPTTLLFFPPVCVNLGLAWFFGHTLAAGQEALITHFARLEQALPDPEILAYTRSLTWVWTGFFLIMAAMSVVLAASGAHAAWVWFTAVGNYACVAALFALEYGWRRRRFPRKDRVTPWQQVALLRDTLRKRQR